MPDAGGIPALALVASDAEEALDRVRPEMDALDRSAFRRMNVSPSAAASTVLSSLPFLEPLRDDMGRLPRFDRRHIDQLSDYALAAWLTSARDLPTNVRRRTLAALAAEARPLRDLLRISAPPLAQQGLIDAASLPTVPPGPRRGLGLARDLVALAHLYRYAWQRIEGKTLVTNVTIEQAQTLGAKLMAVASLDDSSELARVHGHEDAIRAFTLMDIAYEQCRRGAAYLCYGVDDVEARMPNYRAKRGSAGASVAKRPEPPDDVAPPA